MAATKPKPDFTLNQEQAINHNNHNILVSASAGSGKTTVLVERVIQKVLAKEKPISVDELLIVTFTEAAANEMAERLEAALVAAIEAESNLARQRELQSQLERLPAADISTLHSFALRLIENYYHVINLDPQFRLLGDETETSMMKSDVLDQVFEDLYHESLTATEAKPAQIDFLYLVELFSKDRNDDGLREVVMRLFDFANARPDFDQWLEVQADSFADGQTPFTESKLYQTTLRAKMLKQAQKIETLLNDALIELQDFAGNGDSLGQVAETENDFTESKQQTTQDDDKQVQALTLRYEQIAQEKSYLTALTQALAPDATTSLTQMRTLVNQIQWAKIAGNTRSVVDEDARKAMDLAKAYREDAKANLTTFVTNYLLLDDASYAVATEKIHQSIQALVEVVKRFNVAFSTYKRQKKVLDFNDLEHFALDILKDSNTATTIQSRYQEVMVDEYQDINPLQETILTHVSNGHNMFMVGDIKQSIYGFRLADPDLFGQKYKVIYQPWHEATDEFPPDKELIVLPENFRSHNFITNFINMIFSQIMNESLGDVDYTGASRLEARAQTKSHDLPPEVEVLVYVDELESDVVQFDTTATEQLPVNLTDQEDLTDDKATAQLKIIANKIKSLMHEFGPQKGDTPEALATRLKFQDIAILEPTRNLNLKLIDVFKAAEIPVVVNDAGNYFQTVEINIMMSLLQIIDNPYQDIPLVAVLRSPIVGLDENELAYIRAREKKGNYHVAVSKFMQTYAQADTIEVDVNGAVIYRKLKQFFDLFATWRQLAIQNQLVALIWQIYEDTGYFEYVGGMPAGAQRQANLHALYERAETFAQSSYIGLFSFIKYIEQLRKKNKDLDSAPVESNDDAVRVMTIHASKGQEFPIVFLLDTTHKFRTSDLTQDLLIDNEYGISIPYLEPKHRLQLEVPRQAFVREEYQKRLWAESLRVLYVALTRAKKQLYLVGAYQNTTSMLKRWQLPVDTKTLFIDVDTRLQAASFMDWIGLAISRHPNFYQADKNQFYADVVASGLFEATKLDAKNLLKAANSADKELFTSDFSVYKYVPADLNINVEQATELPNDANDEIKPTSDIIVPPTLALSEQPASAFDNFKRTLNFTYPYEIATKTTAYQSVSEVKRLFEDPDNLEAAQIRLDKEGFVSDETTSGVNRHLDSTFATPQFLQVQDNKVSKLAIGSATHLLLQMVPLDGPVDEKILAQSLKILVSKGIITAPVAAEINLKNVAKMFTTTFGLLLTNQKNKVYREQPFSMLIPANKLYHKFSGGDERVLIHGIIDGYIITEDGNVILFDYKTDYVPDKQIAILIERYAGQLNLYAEALAKIKNLDNSNLIRKVIFSLSLGREIQINNQQVL